jgi:nitric oxide reductase activation protein
VSEPCTHLTLTRPDDWHLHLRDGAALVAVLPDSARRFARAIVMPNLKPLVTDGEPADIDVRDPRHLRHDTKKAVEELATLDPKTDDYVARIFGPKGFMVMDHVNRLPERLPMLYAGLTR